MTNIPIKFSCTSFYRFSFNYYYLVQIKGKYSELNTSQNEQKTNDLNSEIKAIENQLSSYISKVITRATSQNVNLSPITEEHKNTFFDTVINKQTFSNSEAQAMAEIEVNFAHGVAESITNHNRLTCPICSQNDANNISSSGITEELYGQERIFPVRSRPI